VKSISTNNSLRIALVAAICSFAPVTLPAQSAPSPYSVDPASPIPQANQLPPNTSLPNPNSANNPNPAQQDSIGAPGMTGQMMRDKNFLRDVVEANLAEIQLGKLASQKATSAEVKAFAEKMVTDHTNMNQQIGSIADSLGIMVPRKLSKEDQATYDKLNKLPSDQFETQYITLVAMNHRKDLHAFREEMVATNDENIHDAILKTAPIVYEHSKEIEKIARDKNIQLPERKRPAPAPSGE
jgi:putative membrane protein